ncbi:hypothetical protein SLEP1_g23572 [Rubroshorea leprosula]|uniref:Uncharacterized protein n=1 Tax=Rubroshorea leprosula TaxID=152421 RepID=A0AAV5JFV7_9ROSI|nr:hypothetical protein SLEP1_g23572 [Rubroshorea leprosula]
MQIRCLQPGLKTLIYSEETPLIIHSYSVAYSSLSPRSLQSSAFLSLFGSLGSTTQSSLFLSSSSGLDDLLGTESGVYMSFGEGKLLEPDIPPDMAKVTNKLYDTVKCYHTVNEELGFSEEDWEEEFKEFDFLEELHGDQESNIEDHEDDEFLHQGYPIINGASSSVPKVFNGREGLHPRKWFTYSDGFMLSSEYQNSFANHDFADRSSTCVLVHSNSAPFTLWVGPIAAVM